MGLVKTTFAALTETDETWGLGTMKNSAGTLQWNPHNLLKSSEDFSSSDWTKTDTTVTPNAATAPDGTLTADKISHTSTSAIVYQTPTSVDGVVYGGGIFVKYIDHQWFRLDFDVGQSVWVDIQNGVIGTDNTDGTTLTALNDGWYYISTSDAAGGTSFSYNIQLASADNSTIETSGTSAYIWGAHLYRNDLGGMAKVPESDRALAALEYYVPNKAVVTGSNLVSNGTFDSSTAGWSANNATLSAASGKLRVTLSSSGVGEARQTLTTVAGKHYGCSDRHQTPLDPQTTPVSLSGPPLALII